MSDEFTEWAENMMAREVRDGRPRTLTIRSEEGELIGYCESPDIEEVTAAYRAKAVAHLKKLGNVWLENREDVTRYQIYAQVELLQEIGILKGPKP